jgi:hypothetical protein
VDVIRKKFPERDFVPVGKEGSYKRGYQCDSRKIKEELGMKFRTIKETIEDLGEILFDMYDKEKSA